MGKGPELSWPEPPRLCCIRDIITKVVPRVGMVLTRFLNWKVECPSLLSFSRRMMDSWLSLRRQVLNRDRKRLGMPDEVTGEVVVGLTAC